MSKKTPTPSVDETTEYESLLGVRDKDEEPASLGDFLGDDGIQLPDEPWKEHWGGMPDYEQEENKPYKTIYVHFRSEEDYQEFARMIGQKLTEKTKTIWHPKLDRTANALLRWIEEEE